MNIGFDLMGGDLGPQEAIAGALAFFQQNADVRLVLLGNEEACSAHLEVLEPYKERYNFVHAEDIISMHEHATKALKEKPNSSIAMGFGMLKLGKIDAFISAGNTGAMLVGSMYSVGVVPGVARPTIATTVPRLDGSINLLLDVGANADCKPEHLVQFGHLGSLYSEYILGNPSPEVALLNLGEEEGKGNILTQATYALLKSNNSINFVGNVEGRDLFGPKARVIVTDGFTGNVVLKMAESFYDMFKDKVSSDPILDNLNYEVYGGVPVLGVNAAVIIGHGISSSKAYVAMIKSAQKVIETGLIKAFQTQFAKPE